MEPVLKQTVDAGVVFPDITPQSDKTAKIVSKEPLPETELGGADSVADPAPKKSLAPTGSSKDLEEDIARLIQAELAEPDQQDEDNSDDDSAVPLETGEQDNADFSHVSSPAPAAALPPGDNAEIVVARPAVHQETGEPVSPAIPAQDKIVLATDTDEDEDQDPSSEETGDGQETSEGGLFNQEEPVRTHNDAANAADGASADAPIEPAVLKQPLSEVPSSQENRPLPAFDSGEPDEPPHVTIPMEVYVDSHIESKDTSSPSKQEMVHVASFANKDSLLSEGSLVSLPASSSSVTAADSTAPAVRAELTHLLLLILALCGGMGLVLLLSLPRTRRYLLWPVRHWFYTKLPQSDRETPLERAMLRELGEDLIVD